MTFEVNSKADLLIIHDDPKIQGYFVLECSTRGEKPIEVLDDWSFGQDETLRAQLVAVYAAAGFTAYPIASYGSVLLHPDSTFAPNQAMAVLVAAIELANQGISLKKSSEDDNS